MPSAAVTPWSPRGGARVPELAETGESAPGRALCLWEFTKQRKGLMSQK